MNANKKQKALKLDKFPTLKQAKLGPEVENALQNNRGLILVGGKTQSGRTTTVNSMVHYLCAQGVGAIFITDPTAKYNFRNPSITQIQFQKNQNYAATIRAVLRCNPQVLVLGEISTAEVLDLALTASEIGNLIIGTINGATPEGAIKALLERVPTHKIEVTKELLDANLRIITTQKLNTKNGKIEVERKTKSFPPRLSLMTQRLCQMIKHQTKPKNLKKASKTLTSSPKQAFRVFHAKKLKK